MSCQPMHYPQPAAGIQIQWIILECHFEFGNELGEAALRHQPAASSKSHYWRGWVQLQRELGLALDLWPIVIEFLPKTGEQGMRLGQGVVDFNGAQRSKHTGRERFLGW